MIFAKLIEQLVPVLGQKAADELAGQISGLAPEGSPEWQKTILHLVSDAVAKNGVGGVQVAVEEIEKLLDGKPANLDWANLMVASDAVALLQRAEAQRKSEIRDFLAKVGEVLGPILSGIIRGLIAG